MTDAPRVCRCHGEPMRNNGYRNGATQFACAVKKRAANLRAQRRYAQTPAGRAVAAAYQRSPHGRLTSQLRELTRIRY